MKRTAEIGLDDDTEMVSVLLLETSRKGSAAVDSLSGWILGGFAAAIALLIGSIDSLSTHLPVATIRSCVLCFLVVAILGASEKLLASVVAAGAEGAEAGRRLGAEAAFAGKQINFGSVFTEIVSATFPPLRWFVRRSFAKAKSGDLAAGAKSLYRCAQLQGFLVLLQAVFVFRAVYAIARDLAT